MELRIQTHFLAPRKSLCILEQSVQFEKLIFTKCVYSTGKNIKISVM